MGEERKSPMELLLAEVQWEVLPPIEVSIDGVPVATHRGILRIGDKELECCILNDGRRIIRQESLENFFHLILPATHGSGTVSSRLQGQGKHGSRTVHKRKG